MGKARVKDMIYDLANENIPEVDVSTKQVTTDKSKRGKGTVLSCNCT